MVPLPLHSDPLSVQHPPPSFIELTYTNLCTSYQKLEWSELLSLISQAESSIHNTTDPSLIMPTALNTHCHLTQPCIAVLEMASSFADNLHTRTGAEGKNDDGFDRANRRAQG